MANIYDQYASAKNGPSYAFAISGSAASLNIWNTYFLTSNIKTPLVLPVLFVLRATTSCYIRQSNPNNSPLAVTANDFLLLANTYWPTTVDGVTDSNFSVMTVSGTGTLFFTITSQNLETSTTASG